MLKIEIHYRDLKAPVAKQQRKEQDQLWASSNGYYYFVVGMRCDLQNCILFVFLGFAQIYLTY
jgi:hypothetical protein